VTFRSPTNRSIQRIPAADSALNTSFIDVIGNKTDTAAGDSIVSLVKGASGSTNDTSIFTGTVRYVTQAGNDGNSGLSPAEAFATIVYAISVSAAGDAIRVGYGTYDEAGMNINLNSLELWLEAGVILQDSADGTVLTVSGFGSKVTGSGNVRIDPTGGATGVLISGGFAYVEKLRVNGNSVGALGFDITGAGVELINSRCSNPTVAALKIQASTFKADDFCTGGNTTSIGIWVTNTVDNIRICTAGSAGHQTAVAQVDAGCTRVIFKEITTGAGDGKLIDSTTTDDVEWDQTENTIEHHESIYPRSAGEGVAGDPVAVSNSTTDGGGGARDDQNYWGDVAVVIPVDTFTTRWDSIGLYISAVTAADIQQWEMLFTYPFSTTQDGGNDWDENETLLTVVDDSYFEDGDYIWVVGNDRAAGEIVKVSGAPAANVITIARETTADAETGLRYDYDGDASANTVYLVRRAGVDKFEHIEGDFTAATTRENRRYSWHEKRDLPANTGMLMRMLNATDAAASSFDARAIYEG